MANDFPLSLTIKAIDKATAPLREINKRMAKLTEPVRKLNNSFRALSAEAGLPKLAAGLGGVGTSLRNVMSEGVALGAKLTAMAGAGTYGLYRLVRGSVDVGDKLAEMAQRVGLSVDAYAQLQFAAAQADVEQESFNGAMDQFNKRLGLAKAGGGELLGFLTKVAPGLAAQVKGAKSTEEALGLMTGAFEKVTDPGKRAALAAAAFGKSGLQMGQFLGQGAKAIEEQRRKYFALAGSQEAFAKGASDLDNVMREAETAFAGLSAAASGALFPALTELGKALTGLVAGNRAKIAEWARGVGAAISDWVKGDGIGKLTRAIEKWGGRIDWVVGKLGGWPTVLGGISAAILGGPLLGALASLTASVITLGVAIGFTPIGWFLGAVALLAGAALLIYKNWDGIRDFFKKLWEDVKDLFVGFTEFLLGAFLGDLGRAWAGITKMLSGGKGILEAGVKTSPIGLAWSASKSLLAADTARPSGPQMQAAHVTVDFANLPKGARVTADPQSTADLDLSLGYSMVTP